MSHRIMDKSSELFDAYTVSARSAFIAWYLREICDRLPENYAGRFLDGEVQDMYFAYLAGRAHQAEDDAIKARWLDSVARVST